MFLVANKSSKIFAMKHLLLSNAEDDGRGMLNDMAMRLNIVHPNIMSMVQYEDGENHITFVTEYIRYSLLDVFLSEDYEGPSLNEENKLIYAFQAIAGVAAIHKRNVVHHGIQPKNLRLTDGGVLKIGSMRTCQPDMSPVRWNVVDGMFARYAAPELLLEGATSLKSSDIWSLGIVIVDMWRHTSGGGRCGKHEPCFGAIERGKCDEKDEPSSWEELIGSNDPLLVDLVESMLQMKHKERIAARDALNHPVFDRVPDSIRNLCQL